MRWFVAAFALTAAALVGLDWRAAERSQLAMAGPAIAPFPMSGPVVDAADILDAEQERALTAKLEAVGRDTDVDFVFVAAPGLQGQSAARYAWNLRNGWALGEDGRRESLLLIVSPPERVISIDAGAGLEDMIPDDLQGEVLAEMAAIIAAGNMAAGITIGVDRLSDALRAMRA